MRKILIFFIVTFALADSAFAMECKLPEEWKGLCKILQMRVDQMSPKMKLKENDVIKFEEFINLADQNLEQLKQLQKILPKTTVELLMSVRFRNMTFYSAELIAQYLYGFTSACKFANTGAFDENTSHIIGREWSEIDYSGESMSWQGQQKKYAPYNITNFKTLDNIERFFVVESKLPYFLKLYRPRVCKYIQE